MPANCGRMRSLDCGTRARRLVVKVRPRKFYATEPQSSFKHRKNGRRGAHGRGQTDGAVPNPERRASVRAPVSGRARPYGGEEARRQDAAKISTGGGPVVLIAGGEAFTFLCLTRQLGNSGGCGVCRAAMP